MVNPVQITRASPTLEFYRLSMFYSWEDRVFLSSFHPIILSSDLTICFKQTRSTSPSRLRRSFSFALSLCIVSFLEPLFFSSFLFSFLYSPSLWSIVFGTVGIHRQRAEWRFPLNSFAERARESCSIMSLFMRRFLLSSDCNSLAIHDLNFKRFCVE